MEQPRESRSVIKGSPHSEEEVAQVLALRAVRMSLTEIARRTGVPQSTCWDWICRYADVSLDGGELMTTEYRIVQRTQALLMDYLETLEEADGTTLLRHGLVLNAIRGTGIDKLRGTVSPTATAPTLVIVLPGGPPLRDANGNAIAPYDGTPHGS